jgi:hypothetical protein
MGGTMEQRKVDLVGSECKRLISPAITLICPHDFAQTAVTGVTEKPAL